MSYNYPDHQYGPSPQYPYMVGRPKYRYLPPPQPKYQIQPPPQLPHAAPPPAGGAGATFFNPGFQNRLSMIGGRRGGTYINPEFEARLHGVGRGGTTYINPDFEAILPGRRGRR
jgi:hypothetical protein